MVLWNLVFSPSDGENRSPADLIRKLEPRDKSYITNKLKLMVERDEKDWPGTDKKTIKYNNTKWRQVTFNSYRVHFIVDYSKKSIIVLNVYLKRAMKLEEKYKRRSFLNLQHWEDIRK